MPKTFCVWRSCRAVSAIFVRPATLRRRWVLSGNVSIAGSPSIPFRLAESAHTVRLNIPPRPVWIAAGGIRLANGWRLRSKLQPWPAPTDSSESAVLNHESCAANHRRVRIAFSEINPFYALHQLFQFAEVGPSRYASEFQASLLKPAISTSQYL